MYVDSGPILYLGNNSGSQALPNVTFCPVGFAAGAGITTSTTGSTNITITNSYASCHSDYRLKTCIQEYYDAYQYIRDTSAYKYVLIDDEDSIEHTGLIAHELQEAGYTEAVSGEKDAVDDEGNPIYQTVNYASMVPTLWSALHQAIVKIENLEDRVKKLELQSNT